MASAIGDDTLFSTIHHTTDSMYMFRTDAQPLSGCITGWPVAQPDSPLRNGVGIIHRSNPGPNLEEPSQCMPAQNTYVMVGLCKDVQTKLLPN